MSHYQYTLFLAILRVVVIFYIFFGVLPRLFLKDRHLRLNHDRLVASYVFMGSVVLIFMHVLVFLKLYDTISLMLGLVILTLSFIALKHRKDHMTLLTWLNFLFLQSLEAKTRLAIIKQYSPLKLLPKWNLKELFQAFLLLLLLVGSAYLRMSPVIQNAAPFSIEAYKTLEYVKNIEIKSLNPDGLIIPKGMHCLIELFARFSRTDPLILVHLFSALCALVLVYLIYWAVCRLTRNKSASLISAILFGIFYEFLPVNIRQQVEANSVVIGAIFAIPTILFLLEMLIQPRRSVLILIGLGFLATLLISFFWAIILVCTILPFYTTMVTLNKKHSLSSHSTWLLALLLILIGGIAFAAYKLIAGNLMVTGIIRSFMYDDYFNRFINYQPYFHSRVLTGIGIGFSVGLFLLSFFTRRKHFGVGLNFTGVFLGNLIVLWQVENLGMIDLFHSKQIAFVLAVFLCISVGLFINFFFKVLKKVLVKFMNSERHSNLLEIVTVVLFTLIGFSQFRPEQVKFPFQTEPEAFIQSVYRIKDEFPPYGWTIISHSGAKIQTMNDGYFIDYLYFLEYFNPGRINVTPKGRFVTKEIFIFVEKDPSVSNIATELLLNIPDLMQRLNQWCLDYRQIHDNMSVFYEDDSVCVYRICTDSIRI